MKHFWARNITLYSVPTCTKLDDMILKGEKDVYESECIWCADVISGGTVFICQLGSKRDSKVDRVSEVIGNFRSSHETDNRASARNILLTRLLVFIWTWKSASMSDSSRNRLPCIVQIMFYIWRMFIFLSPFLGKHTTEGAPRWSSIRTCTQVISV